MLFSSLGENFHPVLHCSDMNLVVLHTMFTAKEHSHMVLELIVHKCCISLSYVNPLEY